MIIHRFDHSSALGEYVNKQLRHVFPDEEDHLQRLLAHIDTALARTLRCINEVKPWKSGVFDPLHSTQYCQFLYYLSNTLWQTEGASTTCTKLFALNKMLNGIDLFYEIAMPEVFFIGHSVGIVLAKASYANYLVLYQNSTVGKNHGVAPVIEEKVVMYPNTAIIGRSHVRAGTVISQGVGIVNQDTPGQCLAFRDAGHQLVFKTPKQDSLAEIFRL
jgi:serine O-acetyltransferase